MDGFKHGGAAERSVIWFGYLLLVCLSWQLVVAENRTTSAQFQSDGAFLASLSQKRSALFQRGSFLAAPNESVLNASEVSALDQCVGVFLTYEVQIPPVKIHPYNASNQPYSFESLVTLTNFGYKELQLWELSIAFQYDEVIASASDVLFLNGQNPPGLETTNDTRVVGVTTPNLLTSINTAQNQDLIATAFNITGTEFGINSSGFPLPMNLTLTNAGYSCELNSSAPPSALWVCCTENQTVIDSITYDGNFLKRQSGDIIISYDVMTASTTTYKAQVSIVMNDPIGRIDFWNLTWHWTGGEVINTMWGGQVLGGNDQDLCVYGIAAVVYPDKGFQDFMSCSPDPVMVDLQPWASTEESVAIPYCCRNGTLLPDLIDPSQSRSDFQLEVWKFPPHNALDDITPPADWNIGEGYKCTQPSRVSPAEITPGTLHSSSAVASWQVTCNATAETVKKCCVSFSAFYNDSVVPCPTCSCGCSSSKPVFPWNGDSCNPSIEALMIPYNGVLRPPSNRTILAQELARQDHYAIPQAGYPLPCPDNCGVAINWHVYSDYTNGWTARITIFNWETQQVVNWSVAIQMPQAMPGLQEVYSFNGTLVPDDNEFNNTLFMQGHINYNNFFLNAKDSSDDNPGKLQSILSFDKKKTPGINVPGGDGFPKQVWFNGEECQLPDYLPGGDGSRLLPTFYQVAILISVIIFLLTGENIRFL